MWTVVTQAANDWLKHHDARLGAALAYYSVFSLGPLLLIVVAVAGLFFGGDAVREALTGQFRSLLGPTGSQAVEAMLKGAGSTGSGVLSGIFGVLLLLVAALGVVVQLKDALNTIWETKEPESAGVWWYVRTYLISFAGILGRDLIVLLDIAGHEMPLLGGRPAHEHSRTRTTVPTSARRLAGPARSDRWGMGRKPKYGGVETTRLKTMQCTFTRP
jgi:uncharacterized BrkB/YihY/UPF0761 family membrane protein